MIAACGSGSSTTTGQVRSCGVLLLAAASQKFDLGGTFRFCLRT
jgi:hypothetical protein